MAVTAIDTPGLHASADAQSANRSLLKGIKAAWKKHKPNFLVYVDRCVGVRDSFVCTQLCGFVCVTVLAPCFVGGSVF